MFTEKPLTDPDGLAIDRLNSKLAGDARVESVLLRLLMGCTSRASAEANVDWPKQRARQRRSQLDSLDSLLIGGRERASIPPAARQQPKNKMKTAFLLCTAISAALILGSCANQDSAAQTNASSSSSAQYSSMVPGSGAGGRRRRGAGEKRPDEVPSPRQPCFQPDVCYARNRSVPRS